MNLNWDYVKKITLWQYEEVIQKLNGLMAYPVIRSVYNLSMPEAVNYARRLFPGKNFEGGEFPAPILATLTSLQKAGVLDMIDLLSRLDSRAACERLLGETRISFEALVHLLNYLLRWAFPFQTSTRELFDHDRTEEATLYQLFKQHHIKTNFDVLELGQSPRQRQSLAEQIVKPLDTVSSIVHRADIARLPYVRRKTILPVCGAGYDTLQKIAAANIQEMEAAMETYFRTQGKSWDDYKSVIVLRLMIDTAQAVPKIVLI
jgi:hypothetical protein